MKPYQEYSLLYVEDIQEQRQAFKEICRKRFGNCYSAGDGIEGLEIIKKHLPDIVIADESMPRMNGYDMIIEAKKYFAQHPELPEPAFALYTIHDDKCYNAPDDIDLCLIKPTEPESICKDIVKILESRKTS